MATRQKDPQQEAIEQQQAQEQEAQAQQAAAMQVQQDLANVAAVEEQAKAVQQQATNKAHDAENLGEEDTSLDNITEEDVKEAYERLLKYKERKADIEKRYADNELFWKMQHWDVMYRDDNKNKDDGRIKPKSAWLFNTIINKHADAMDNYPEPNILPRNEDDEEAADALSKIIPKILEYNDYEQVYSDTQWYKAKNGTSVQGIFWNNDKANGMGDVEIKKIDVLNLYWKSGITNIQDSPDVFQVTMMDNEEIKERYPDIKVGNNGLLPIAAVDMYAYGEDIDTTEQTPIIDWYYKKRVQGTDDMGIPQVKTYVHYCKFCNGQVIYASENDPKFVDRGWYDHGLYPYVFDVLFPVEASICGLGYIDITKDDQLYIDKLQQAILESAVANARPRWAVRTDSNINEAEFMDLSKPLVHFEGNLGEGSYTPIEGTGLNGIYETVYLNKVQEMKDTSGNTAATQGQASSVTSASGIASLQEAAGKLARDSNNASYRSFKQVIYQVIELIRQFYDEPRWFMVSGEDGANNYVSFDNQPLQPQSQGQAFGIDLGSRLPIMDIEVKPQKKSAYSKESQNQTALNLYNMGFFSPNNVDASLACLEMMDFDGIERMRDKVSQNGTLMDMVNQLQQQLLATQQQLMQLGFVVDTSLGTNIAGQTQQAAQETQAKVAQKTQAKQGGNGSQQVESKGSLNTQAASASRNSTSPK